jgi:hypothetical protein
MWSPSHGFTSRSRQREAQRPVCADCGQNFTDDRWKAGTAVEWGRGDSRPHLCDDCKHQVIEAERTAAQAERERQEQECREQERREVETAQASQKAGGCVQTAQLRRVHGVQAERCRRSPGRARSAT